MKKQQRIKNIDDIDFPDNQDPIEEQGSKQYEVMQRHLLLHNLAVPYKEVFMLRVFGELRFKQIADIIGLASLITEQEYNINTNRVQR